MPVAQKIFLPDAIEAKKYSRVQVQVQFSRFCTLLYDWLIGTCVMIYYNQPLPIGTARL